MNEWKDGRWQRFWESEQNDYISGQTYAPQTIDDILIWTLPGEEKRFILTLGVQPWCTSTWHPVYYRVWRD